MDYAKSNFKAGQVYTCFDIVSNTMYVRMLIRQLDESDNFSDGWGHSHHTPFGNYWQVVELTTGELSFQVDNIFNSWINLTDYSDKT